MNKPIHGAPVPPAIAIKSRKLARTGADESPRFGSLMEVNASISGAEAGCQGEVGSAAR